MTTQYNSYKFFRALMAVILSPFYPVRSFGRGNMPDGAAIVCGNHSHWIDPLLIIFAIDKKHHLHMMAKKELFQKPIVGRFLKAVGMFPVDRSSNDISSVRTVIKYLRSGEKVGIFPEGTRVKEESGGTPRNGAVYFAAKLGVPIVPVYVPRDKKRFHTVPVVVGSPYTVDSGVLRDAEALSTASADLMARINALKEQLK